MVSSSADKTVRVWDVETGCSVKKCVDRDLQGVVNGVATNRTGSDLVLTASDDGIARLYDVRKKVR